MTSAFEFYMPQIDFKAICNTKSVVTINSRKLRQANRRNTYIVKKWQNSYTYKLLMYGVQNVNHYNLMCSNALAQYEVINNQIEIEAHRKLLMFNHNKFTSMKEEIINIVDYINKLKSELYKIVYTSTNLFREHKNEVLAFINTPLHVFTY